MDGNSQDPAFQMLMCRLISAVSHDLLHYHCNIDTNPTMRGYSTYILESSLSHSCSRGRVVNLVEVTSLIEDADTAPQEHTCLQYASDEPPMGIIIHTSQDSSHRIFTWQSQSLQTLVAVYLGVVLMARPYPLRVLPSKRLDSNLPSRHCYRPTPRLLSQSFVVHRMHRRFAHLGQLI